MGLFRRRGGDEAGDRILMTQRPPGGARGLEWEFPGGKIEPGETPEAAAIRECLEEAGIAVEPLFRYPEHVQQYDHGPVHLHFIACQPCEVPQTPREPFRWVAREKLASLEFPAGNKSLLAVLLQSAEKQSENRG